MIGVASSQGFAARFARRPIAEPGAPAAAAPPSISGEARIGQTLSAHDGDWTGDPAPTLARAWLRDGAPTPGATGPNRLLTAADDGREIAVQVTATNPQGTRIATSAPVLACYAAPVLSTTLPDMTLAAGRPAGPSNLAAAFTVAGDPALAGAAFALAPGSAPLPDGLTLAPDGTLGGSPAAAAGPIPIVVRCANSGGHADAAFSITIAEAAAADRIVVAYMGQSNIEYLMASAPFFINPSDPYPTVSAENVRVILGPGASETPISDILITNAVTAARGVNIGLAAMAEFLSWLAPSTQFVILDLAVSGTGRRELADDDDTDRNWSAFAALVDHCETNYGPVDILAEFWTAADVQSISKFGPNFAPLYWGERWNGSAFTLGDVNPDWNPSGSTSVDHCLWDVTAAPEEKGRGVFARAATKHAFMQARGFGTGSFASDPRYPAIAPGRFYPPLMALSYAVGGHTLIGDYDGQVGLFRTAVVPILDKLGLFNGAPTVIDYEMGGGGAYCDFTVSLPNGGDLTTMRALEGREAAPSGWLTRQQVYGFRIQRASDAPNVWNAIVNSAETGEAASYRGLVTIEDAGSGSGPDRTATIRVTPDVAFSEGDRIGVLMPAGAVSGDSGGADHESSPFKVWLDHPIEHVASLRNPEALYPFPGFPVERNPISVIVGATPPAAPETFWTQESGGPWFRPASGSGIPGGTFRMAYKTRVRFTEAGRVRGEPAGQAYLWGQGGDYLRLGLYTDPNDTIVSLLRVFDSSGASVLPAAMRILEPLRAREWVEIEVDIDLAARTAIAKVDGATVASTALSAGTGAFANAANRQILLGARLASGANSLQPGLQVAFHEVAGDNGSGLTVLKRIEGGAAAVNADGWRQGSAAT